MWFYLSVTVHAVTDVIPVSSLSWWWSVGRWYKITLRSAEWNITYETLTWPEFGRTLESWNGSIVQAYIVDTSETGCGDGAEVLARGARAGLIKCGEEPYTDWLSALSGRLSDGVDGCVGGTLHRSSISNILSVFPICFMMQAAAHPRPGSQPQLWWPAIEAGRQWDRHLSIFIHIFVLYLLTSMLCINVSIDLCCSIYVSSTYVCAFLHEV